MRSSSTATFRKLKTCPSSETLLLHGQARTPAARRSAIRRHLAACDFCGAEMQLLTRFPPSKLTVRVAPREMPRPLRRLAEELLAGAPPARARYAEALDEIERLTLTDAR